MPHTVILRSHDDMPHVAETLAMLRRQTIANRVIVFENASADGTREVVQRLADRVVDVPENDYLPGRVLNQAMELAEGELVTFLNADSIPQHDDWLERLLAGFDSQDVAAVFGRQVANPRHHLMVVRDTEETFGDGKNQASWRHCFSMAAAAIRRSVWMQERFDESLRYSEDIEWTWRAKQKGYIIRYVANAVAMHSNDYSVFGFYRRHFGEGEAEARIFEWDPWRRSILRYSILPFVKQLGGDVRYIFNRGAIRPLLDVPAYRMAQMLGRRAGFRRGWRLRGRRSE